MNRSKLLLLALAGLLFVPAAMALAQAPPVPTAEPVPAAELPAETPAETPEEPPAAEGEEAEIEIDLEFLEVPEFQRKLRECDPSEAAAAGCTLNCCIFVRDAPLCFC